MSQTTTQLVIGLKPDGVTLTIGPTNLFSVAFGATANSAVQGNDPRLIAYALIFGG